jgi:hypothetical protein
MPYNPCEDPTPSYTKPLEAKAYGSIPHLPGSSGTGNHTINEGQARICCEQSRPGDWITVQEKLDGSCCAVANVDGALLPLTRAGNLAWESNYLQHRLFAMWATYKQKEFSFLEPGERLVGEWLAQAHGTRYDLQGKDPFVSFDIMTGSERLPDREFRRRVSGLFRTPALLYQGQDAFSIEQGLEMLRCVAHYKAEGMVWRVERNGRVEFLCKYVRPDYVAGRYLPCYTGKSPIWNVSPEEIYAACV